MNDFNNVALYTELALFECGKEDCVKNKAISLTKKTYHLFHYVTAGQGTLILNNKEYLIKKGTIFFIPEDTDAIYFPDKEKPWSYVWVGFHGSKVQEYLDCLNINIDNPIVEDTNKVYKQYFDNLFYRYTINGQLDISVLGALYQLFGEMIFQKEGKSAASSSKVTTQLAKDFILNNYQFDIGVNDIAKNANVTPNYLSTIFQREEHMSTKTFLIKVRMEKAMSLLVTNRFSVKDVSKMVGYSNQLYFSSEFRKYYGNPPSFYIKGEK